MWLYLVRSTDKTVEFSTRKVNEQTREDNEKESEREQKRKNHIRNAKGCACAKSVYLSSSIPSSGTTVEFATIPFHRALLSAALVEPTKPIRAHPLILSSHLFFCLPLLLFPFTVPCKIVFAKPIYDQTTLVIVS